MGIGARTTPSRHAEVGLPASVVVGPDARGVVVGKRRAAAQIVAPDGVVGGVDHAVLVVGAGPSGRDGLEDHTRATDKQTERTGGGGAKHEAVVDNAVGRENGELL